MTVEEYCGTFDHSILQFTFSLIDDVKTRIKEKKLFYQEQVHRYISKQIDLFFTSSRLNRALTSVYKHEMHRTIMFRLNSTMKEIQLFRCV
ncbi:hypothetical protein [Metabacillus iocasae]|uniref:Uncharacterized protein n=1 Tax=Priestia iocasae TaxID=2291674 RepID=A0ABS2QRL7_9BACI|nr:hypothetical protein [Metabacillus iocasae]MBM7702050.1 hypothetical protein [Metabacillus iocasae]